MPEKVAIAVNRLNPTDRNTLWHAECGLELHVECGNQTLGCGWELLYGAQVNQLMLLAKTGVPLRIFNFAVALVLVCASPLAAETRLGVVSAGQVVRLRVTDLPPLSRILIRIDGDDVAVPLTVQGGDLLVTLPADLQGVSHDLVVLRRQPDQDQALQTFTFETPTGQTAYALSGTAEAGVLAAQDRTAGYATGNGRFSFEVDRGRVTGGVTLARTLDATTGKTATKVSDYFLERRVALWGDDLTTRLGSQFFEDDLALFDGAARAGLSVRLTDADRRYEAEIFGVQASDWDGARPTLGLADAADRVLGAKGYLYPFAGRGLKLTYAGYSGRVPLLPSDTGGTSTGWAGSISLPFAQDRGSLSAGFAQTSYDDGTGKVTGRALDAEASILVTPPGDAQSLTLTASHTRVDPGFYSALNADLIPDETRTELKAAWYAPQFQTDLSLSQALNDLANSPTQPTDRFREVTLDLYYTPQDFTGGFWNGTSLNLSLHSEDQRRTETPAGALAPQDHRFDSLTLGIDRFRADTSWALRYSHESLTDLTGGGDDQQADRVEALYAYTVTDDITVNLAARYARIEQDGAAYEERDLSASVSKQLIVDRLRGSIGMGELVSEVPTGAPGRYLSSELALEFLPDQEFVVSVDYGSGSKAHYLTAGDGWLFGLAYRQDFNLFRGN